MHRSRIVTPQQLFQSIVGLGKDYDWPDGRVRDILFYGPDSPFPRKHIPHYQLIGDIVCALYGAYDFTRSPKFLASVSGKTPEFCRMKLKMETTAEKRTTHREQFLNALERLPLSREVYDLLDGDQHAQLDKIVGALNRIEREPAPSPASTLNSTRQELDTLLDDALRMALQLVAKHGSHIPFAMIVTPTGQRANIAADNSIVRDPEVLFATVRDELIKTIQRQGARAFALASNVHYKRRDTGEDTDATQVQLEHIDGTSVTCYLPYQVLVGQSVPGELFAIDSTERLFP